MSLLDPIHAFLPCKTPEAWIQTALTQQDILLIDHAQCEKKAAATALQFMYRYDRQTDLLFRLSRLAREELRHFERVLSILKARNIAFTHLSPSRYAAGLREHARTHEPARMIDLLIINAFIEARSCERFAAIAPHLDETLEKFYTQLLASEARHFEHYLGFAQQYSEEDIAPRVKHFAEVEEQLMITPDPVFRFHSGVPA